MWKEKTASGILNTVRVCVTKQNDTIFYNPFSTIHLYCLLKHCHAIDGEFIFRLKSSFSVMQLCCCSIYHIN